MAKDLSDSFIMDIVAHCHLDIDVGSNEHLLGEGVVHVFDVAECKVISQGIANLLEVKVIMETPKQDGKIISPIFLGKKKKNSEWSLIWKN